MILKNKIIFAQAPLGIVVIVISMLFLFSIYTIGSETNSILSSNYKSLIALQEMRKIVDNLDEVAWKAAHSRINKGEVAFKITNYKEDFNKQLEVQKNNITISGEVEITLALEKKWIEAAILLRNFITHQGSYIQIYDNDLRSQLQEVKAAISLVSDLNEDDIFYRTESITLAINHISKVLLVITLLAFLIGLLISGALINKVLKPLSVIINSINQASNGKIDVKLDVTGDDEVADLGREFNKLVTSIESYRNSTVGHVIQTQLFMQGAIDSYPDPIWIMDKNLKTLHINHSAAEFFKFDNAKNYMEDFIEILPQVVRDRVVELSRVIINDSLEDIPENLRNSIYAQVADKRYEFLINAKPVYETLKGVIGIALIMRNITNLNVKGYIKTENVSQMMHSLLQPLNSIHIAIHACLDQKIGALSDKQAEVLAYARNDCFRLRRNMVNLQDLNYIETTQFSVLHRINLVEVIKDVITSFEVLASTQEITIHAEYEAPESYVYANDYQIKLVLENLIDNAISHSNPGYKVSIKLYERDGKIKLLMHNGGTVIPPEYKRKIFDKFFQLPGEQSSKDGLGLYICKTIIENYGGKIGVKSSERLGTSFWLTLPKSE